MPASMFRRVAATLFALVALAHVARLVLDVPVAVGGVAVPIAVSWVALPVFVALSAWGFRARP